MPVGGTGERPFHFLASWQTHPEFRDVVAKSWKPDASISANLDMSTQKIKEWNRTVFGNIFS